MSRLVLLTCAAAFATFCVVQDRVTAAGARRYVDTQHAALTRGPGVTIDEVMRPAVRSSVQQGLLWGGLVAGVGVGGVWLRRTRRE